MKLERMCFWCEIDRALAPRAKASARRMGGGAMRRAWLAWQRVPSRDDRMHAMVIGWDGGKLHRLWGDPNNARQAGNMNRMSKYCANDEQRPVVLIYVQTKDR